jgi:hypothetical protein
VDTATAEKIARNNAVFRDANDEIAGAAAEHGLKGGAPVPFVCECSDPRCTKLIRLTLEDYEAVRRNPRWFFHAAGHETSIPGAVRPVEDRGDWVLVEKMG